MSPGHPTFDKSRFCQSIHTLHELVPHLFVMVLSSGPYVEHVDKVTQVDPIAGGSGACISYILMDCLSCVNIILRVNQPLRVGFS